MKRVLKLIGWFLLLSAAARAVGAIAERSFNADTEPGDDELRRAAYFGGSEVRSTATALTSLNARVRMGGLAIDLSQATLAEDGAVADIDVMMGGVALTVASGWRVDVESALTTGDVSVDVPDSGSLPDDAPRLLVRVTGRAGGVAVGVD